VWPGELREPAEHPGDEAFKGAPPRTAVCTASVMPQERRDPLTDVPAHVLCALLQTLDGGAPVSPSSVARELGHAGDAIGDGPVRLTPRFSDTVRKTKKPERKMRSGFA
jgi:hypothetical protein